MNTPRVKYSSVTCLSSSRWSSGTRPLPSSRTYMAPAGPGAVLLLSAEPSRAKLRGSFESPHCRSERRRKCSARSPAPESICVDLGIADGDLATALLRCATLFPVRDDVLDCPEFPAYAGLRSPELACDAGGALFLGNLLSHSHLRLACRWVGKPDRLPLLVHAGPPRAVLTALVRRLPSDHTVFHQLLGTLLQLEGAADRQRHRQCRARLSRTWPFRHGQQSVRDHGRLLDLDLAAGGAAAALQPRLCRPQPGRGSA